MFANAHIDDMKRSSEQKRRETNTSRKENADALKCNHHAFSEQDYQP